jgi:hypothetical protein
MDHFNVSWLWLPVLARVREHAKFPEILERVGLAGYWRAKDEVPPSSVGTAHFRVLHGLT